MTTQAPDVEVFVPETASSATKADPSPVGSRCQRRYKNGKGCRLPVSDRGCKHTRGAKACGAAVAGRRLLGWNGFLKLGDSRLKFRETGGDFFAGKATGGVFHDVRTLARTHFEK